MTEWRERGFVQDSDNEDDNISDDDLQNGANIDTRGKPLNRSIDEELQQDEPRETLVELPDGLSNTTGSLKNDRSALLEQARFSEQNAFHATGAARNGADPEENDDIDELQLDEHRPGVESKLGVLDVAKLKPTDEPNLEEPPVDDLFDIPSSPLSEVPSSITRDKDVSSPSAPFLQPASSSALRNIEDLLQEPAVEHFVEIHDQQVSTSTRAFRQRNPIQLHPYLLEGEQYRQALRSRGLRPVAVAYEGRQDVEQTQEDDNANEPTGNEPGSQSSLFMSSQSSSPSLPNLSSRQRDENSEKSDGELPSVTELLKTPANGGVLRSVKRQKLTHNRDFHSEDTRFSAVDGHSVGYTTPNTSEGAIESNPVVLIPSHGTKPIESLSKRRKRRLKKFRFPRGFDAPQLPTPLPSSGSRRRRRRTMYSDSEPDSAEHRLDAEPRPPQPSSLRSKDQSPAVVASARTHSPVLVPSNPSDSERIQKVSKRIRGVLPASWLRLDQGGQRAKVPQLQDHAPRRSIDFEVGNQRGVAQRVTSNTRRERQFSNEMDEGRDVSDAASSVQSRASQVSINDRSRELSPGLSSGLPPLSFEAGDVVEEDFIDPMLPTVQRKRTGKPRKKRQLRLFESFDRSKDSVDRPPNQLEARQGRTRGSSELKKPGKTKAPSLSIVDAVQSMPRKSMPNFVRLAVRQASTRPNQGRHSPNRKALSLHTKEDNIEARKDLGRWRKGRITHWAKYVDPTYRAAQNAPKYRPMALMEGSVNRQSRLPPTEEKLPSESLRIFPRERDDINTSIIHPQTRTPQLQSHLEPNRIQPSTNISPVSAPYRNLEASGATSHAPRRQRRKSTVSGRRPGQLEDLQQVNDEIHRDSAFRRDLQNLELPLDHVRSYNQRTANPMLERFINDPDVSQDVSDASVAVASKTTTEQEAVTVGRTKGTKKRRPARLSPNNRAFERLRYQEDPRDLISTSPTKRTPIELSYLSGLGPFGTKYTTDFDVNSLPPGTFFHETTFIGSGELHGALELESDSLDEASSHAQFDVDGYKFSLGPWVQECSTSLEDIFNQVSNFLLASTGIRKGDINGLATIAKALSSTSSALRSTIAYYAGGLSFLDPIDRVFFSSFNSRRIEAVLETANAINDGPNSNLETGEHRHLLLRVLSLLAVCAFESMQVAKHELVGTDIQIATKEVFGKVCSALVKALVDVGFSGIRNSLQLLSEQSHREAGIRNDQVEIEALVIAHHVTEKADIPKLHFWELVNIASLRKHLQSSQSVIVLEDSWSQIFQSLPALDFDTFGTIRPGLRLTKPTAENWFLVKVMVHRLFQLYSKAVHNQTPSLNTYIRATMTRCFNLVQSWDWRKCELILGEVFDFFAGRNFALLQNEDCVRPQIFLEKLDSSFTLAIDPSDRSFDIFLKLLAAGLRSMQTVYAPKKIKNIAWRLIPNHGRTHAKENDLREDDLDALRNHHNLLSILYWASPASYRINLDLIRNLVDFQSSHSEVCRLNVRTWANLLRFQVSTDDEETEVDPFATWVNSMISNCLRQHEKARPEAESMITNNTKHLLEVTVANNEQQIESILSSILALMSDIIGKAKSVSTAVRLFEKSNIFDVLRVFNPKHSRFGSVISLALDTCHTYFDILEKKPKSHHYDSNEDSQDYGEISFFDDVEDDNMEETAPAGSQAATEAVQHLLSNAFGEEGFSDEKFLQKVVDTWVRICHFHVKRSNREWSYYIDNQGPGSWNRLRDTEQARKFGSYFLSAIILRDEAAFSGNLMSVLSIWLTSLVERDAMLKYQHVLTAALFNADPENPLLSNLPFAKANDVQVWNISLHDLRTRRLSLLSSVFSNMRECYYDSFLLSQSQTTNRRVEFTVLLKQLMQAMKKKYTETQPSSTMRGAYVEFAQGVVELLQQYTADICPIDKFFTDSTAFPLPANDPTYVVGRLKNYSLQLGDSSVQKKLATFIQNACERTVVDNQQSYLVKQLAQSLDGHFESAVQQQPSLRCFLLNIVFPSYVESAFSTDCGWLLAAPILEVAHIILDDLLYCFSVSDRSTTLTVTTAINSMLIALCKAASLIPSNLHMLRQPHVLVTLARVFDTTTAALMPIDYIHRTWDQAINALNHVSFLQTLSSRLEDSLQQEHMHSPPLLHDILTLPTLNNEESDTDLSFTSIRSYCKHEIRETLAKSWVNHNGRYFVLRGSTRKEVIVPAVGGIDQAKGRLLDAMVEFKSAVARFPAFNMQQGAFVVS